MSSCVDYLKKSIQGMSPVEMHAMCFDLDNNKRQTWYRMAKHQRENKNCVDPFVLAKILTLPGEDLGAKLNKDESGQESLIVSEKSWDPTFREYFYFDVNTFKSC